jgi:DNA-binding winged helix-turn-helix (wHTH) protein
LTKEMLLNHLYGGMDEPELKIIDVFVCKLRKKLAQATGGEHYIETVWGRGHRLRDPASMSAAKLIVRPEDLGHEPLKKRSVWQAYRPRPQAAQTLGQINNLWIKEEKNRRMSSSSFCIR